MATRDQLSQWIYDGENSFVEFKEDAVKPEQLAREFVAFANFRGGIILLGVRDDGSVAGITRPKLEEWVMQCARDKVEPPLIPSFELVRDYEGGATVAVVRISPGPEVHAFKDRGREGERTYYIRVGSITRVASNDELARLFQQRLAIRAELSPVVAATMEELDERRLRDYIERVRGQNFPNDALRRNHLLTLLEFAVAAEGTEAVVPTIAGLLCFGSRPNRFLTGAIIEAVAFPTVEARLPVDERLDIIGPMVMLGSSDDAREGGVVETALDFFYRHAERLNSVVGATREIGPRFPHIALREAVVNAVAHRDYRMTTRPTQFRVFQDRIEVISPGRLPNGITVEGMKVGARGKRNEVLESTLADYGYSERMSLGVPTMIREMEKYNGTEPRILEFDEGVSVTLFR